MIDWRFAEVHRIHLVWLALAIVVALGVLELRNRSALAAFLSPVMQRRLTARATTGRVIAPRERSSSTASAATIASASHTRWIRST